VKLTTHLFLVPKSRMSGSNLHPQYVFMARCLVKHRNNFINKALHDLFMSPDKLVTFENDEIYI